MANPTPSVPALLRTDCTRCAALCCVATTFSPSADFPCHKPAGQACQNLGADAQCTIHPQLRSTGWQGCVAFDCFGAGQRVTAEQGDWRERRPADQQRIFATWHRMVGLHQLLWYLHQAAALAAETTDAQDVSRLRAQVQDTAAGGPPVPAATAPEAGLRSAVNDLLLRISASHRAPAGRELSRSMQLGADLRGARLERASLFAACLVGADLRGADLRGADLRGTDLRGADLRGTDLRGVLFLAPGQLSSARQDAATLRDPSSPRD